MTGIVVENLTKTYRRGLAGERVRALDGVSLTIQPGEAFGIIGPNGAGKTTFLGCLLGFLRPDAGRVTIDGHDPDDLAVRAATGYLPERLDMDRWMNGRDFLAYHHALARLPEHDRDTDVERALASVGLDADAAARPIRKYSRGMLQRIGLAQALLGTPRYVFLDEPASGVDPAGVLLFRRILGELKGAGVTVVLNSHQLEQVERLCDRVAFVSRGRVEAIETMRAGATAMRVLRVRWAAGAPVTYERLAALATNAGAELVMSAAAAGGGGSVGVDPGAETGAASVGSGAANEPGAPREARFLAADDATAARLVHALVLAGVPVAEVIPEESRLERLFLEPRAGGGA